MTPATLYTPVSSTQFSDHDGVGKHEIAPPPLRFPHNDFIPLANIGRYLMV